MSSARAGAQCPQQDLGSALPVSVSGNTAGGANNVGGASCGEGGSGAPEATYRWTAPADGWYVIDTAGSDFDTVLYVRNAACDGAELACNDDDSGATSAVLVTLGAGQSVVVVVDGFGASSGNFNLHIDIIGPIPTPTLTPTPSPIPTSTWVGHGPAAMGVSALVLDPTNPSTVYAAGDRGVWKSVDGGETWASTVSGLYVKALAMDPANPNVVYAGIYDGVFKSVNGGLTWVAVGLSDYSVDALAIDPANPNVVYAGTDYGGVFKSQDAAASWELMGLADGVVPALGIETGAGSVIYAGTGGHGVYKSVNGTSSWGRTGLAAGRVAALAIDSVTRAIAYAGTDSGAVYRSSDHGASWTQVAGPLGTAVSVLAIDPTTPATIYAGTAADGVFKTMEGSGSWQAASAGLPNDSITALAIDPVTPATIYAGTLFSGVFKSTDSAGTWSAVGGTGLTDTSITALAVDSAEPSTIYAATKFLGVFKSTDGGATWAATGLSTTDVRALIIDPTDSDTVYAGSGSGVHKTTDGGAAWTELNAGLTNTDVLSLALDPTNPAILLAGTNGGGVFLLDQAALPPVTPTTPSEIPTPTFTPIPEASGTVSPTGPPTPSRTLTPATPTHGATTLPTSTRPAVTPTFTFRPATPTFSPRPPTVTITLTPPPSPTRPWTPTVPIRLRVSGSVTNAVTRARLAGVLVSLAGQTSVTDSNGYYEFQAVDLTAPRTLTATKSGFNAHSTLVSAPSGAVAVVHDFSMTPQASKPIISSVRPQYDGFFLAGLPVSNQYTASAAWNGTPGTVEFYANDRLKQIVPGTSTGAAATFNMGQDFTGSLRPGANQVRVVARNAEGLASDTYRRDVCVLPLPPALLTYLGVMQLQPTASDVHVALDYTFPDPPITQTVNLPVIGRWGVEVAANGSFDYSLADGDWEAALGVGAEGRQGKRGRRPVIPGLTRSPKMKLYFGNKEASFSVTGLARGAATCGSGVQLNEAELAIALGLNVELGRVGLLDLIGPGVSTAVGSVFPSLSSLLNTISILIALQPQFGGNATFDLDPRFAFEVLQVTGDVALQASYEPNLGVAKMNLYVGGRPGMTLQVPGQLIRQLRFRAYAGAWFEWWVFRLPSSGAYEYVFVNVTYPPGTAASRLGTDTEVVLKAVPHEGPAVGAMPRGYLQAGPPRFVAGRQVEKVRAFRALGQRRAAVTRAAEGTADLTLVENVFPNGQPAVASKGTELMLLYVSDNGAGESLQRTDINWMRYDGSTWTAPQPILADTRAEFAPQVAFDGNGDALAVWQRVKDPNFTAVDIAAMAAEMEIVWARWNHTTGQWTAPAALTDNNYLDHLPQLAGPAPDGSLILAWTENQQNLLMGTAEGGDASKDTVRWSRWDAGARSWSAPQVLVANLAGRTSQAFAGAVYVWTQDLDGNLSDLSDQEVFYVFWTPSGWSAVSRLTNDAVADQNVRAAVDAAGDLSLVWQRGSDLVLDRNLAGTPVVARPDSQTVAFADYALTVGPAGNLVLVWQEQSEDGVDAHYTVYDPASGRWRRDERLFADRDLERSFAPTWDGAGSLTIAYNRVQIQIGSKTVTTEEGDTVTIENVPQPGRVDLAVVKRALAQDVGFKPGDFTTDASSFLPGDTVTLTAAVRNLGDLPAENLEVAFYDGDPAAGGTEILPRQAVAGTLDGAASTTVSTTWVVPEPAAPHTLYAVVDPDQLANDQDRLNNQLSIDIGGIDLAVNVASKTVDADGSSRVVVEVVNRGAPAAPASTVAIRYAEEAEGAPLATASVPALDPGSLVQVALNLPAGSASVERLFTITADDTQAVADVDRTNNNLTFAMGQPPEPCVGDCDSSRRVSIDELVTGLNIALGTASADTCWQFDANADGQVTIDELVAAVNRALSGCGRGIDQRAERRVWAA